MATPALAQETILSLRREIARIEGTLAERLEAPGSDDDLILRRHGAVVAGRGIFPTGVASLDEALGGGLACAALTEIHGAETRDAGGVAGFVLGLLGVLRARQAEKLPILWIGASEMFREAGFPYALGTGRFGIGPEDLLFAQAEKLVDLLWIAEEAARVTALSAVLLELRGNAPKLDLTATLRLHRRAQETGRPVFLLRQAARAEPTAAPVRLVVAPASSGLRHTYVGALPHSIGPPGFDVTVGKSRLGRPARLILEWNADEHLFRERQPLHLQPENPVAVVPLSRHGTHLAAAAGERVALKLARVAAATRRQPSGEQHATHSSP